MEHVVGGSRVRCVIVVDDDDDDDVLSHNNENWSK